QALSFIFKGGSYFPATVPPRRRSPVHLNGTMEFTSPAVACTTLDIGDAVVESVADTGATNINLTERQKSVLARLGRGDSNKAIARVLGIREGTVKVHVRQIMRKLGVTNRTQVAIACASGAGNGAEMRTDDRSLKAKLELAPGAAPLGVSLAGGKI